MKIYGLSEEMGWGENDLTEYDGYMYHGLSARESASNYFPYPTQFICQDREPLHIVRNVSILPDVFSPGSSLVVSEKVRDALRNTGLPNLVFDKVVIDKVFSLPRSEEECSSKMRAEFEENPIEYLSGYPGDDDLLKEMPDYYEWVPADYAKLHKKYSPTLSIEEYSIYCNEPFSIRLDVCPDLFREYPYMCDVYSLMVEPLFDVLRTFMHPSFYNYNELEIPDEPVPSIRCYPLKNGSDSVDEHVASADETFGGEDRIFEDIEAEEEDLEEIELNDEVLKNIQVISQEISSILEQNGADDVGDIIDLLDEIYDRDPNNPSWVSAIQWIMEQGRAESDEAEAQAIYILHDQRPLPDSYKNSGVLFPPERCSKQEYFNQKMAAATQALLVEYQIDPEDMDARMECLIPIERQAMKRVWKELKREWKAQAKQKTVFTVKKFPSCPDIGLE